MRKHPRHVESRSDAPRGRIRHLVLALVALVVGAAGLPGVAAADPPSSGSESSAGIACPGDPTVEVSLVQGEGYSFLDVFAWSDAGEWWGSGSTEEFDFDGTTLVATVEVYGWSEEGGEEFLGVAELSAVLTPVGDPDVFEDDGRDGNRRFRILETWQPAEVSGSLVLEGFFDIDLSTCDAHLATFEYWTTNPAATIFSFSGTYLECELAGTEGTGSLFAEGSGTDAYADLYLEADGVMLAGSGEAVFTDTSLTATIDLFEQSGDDEPPMDEPMATAQVDATLESLGTTTERIKSPHVQIRRTIESFAVTGTVAIDGMTWDLDDCVAEAYDIRELFVDPNGPPTTGRPPANDLPANAEPVELGDTVRDRTNAAVPPPEAECMVSFPEEPEFEFPVPLGKTVWYSFTGTGGPVTIDSAGSDFDTVLGVYDTGLEQVACVDDVEAPEFESGLQAAVTVDTVMGQTYLVQAGGFGYFPEDPESVPDYGRLLLTFTG